jgi:biopolymer transport protein ExbD
MPKIKAARKSTFIDMTPMVDLAFLLITFFMLIIQFAPEESVSVTTPSSSDLKSLPTSSGTADTLTQDILKIIIDKEGRIFLGVEKKETRVGILERIMQENPNIKFSQQAMDEFYILPDIGVAMEDLPKFLEMPLAQRKKLMESPTFKGIPIDSTDNQVYKYISIARKAYLAYAIDNNLNNKLIDIMVKADAETPYPVIREVFATLKKQRANRFHLITNKEGFPDDFVQYRAPGPELEEAQ